MSKGKPSGNALNEDGMEEDKLDALLSRTAKWIAVSYILGAAAALVWGFL